VTLAEFDDLYSHGVLEGLGSTELLALQAAAS